MGVGISRCEDVRNVNEELVNQSSNGNLNNVIRLVKICEADVNYESDRYEWKTAFNVAYFNEHLDVAKYLLENDADVNIPQVNGYTVLMIAVGRDKDNSYDEVEMLINYGADLDAQDSQGQTALMFAASNDDENIVEILMMRGADPDIETLFGEKAIDFTNSEEIRDIILSEGLPGPKGAKKN